MLSVRECRRVLGDKTACSDDELEKLSRQIEEFAVQIVETYHDDRMSGVGSQLGGMSSLPGSLSDDELGMIEERAAILEFEGGNTRSTSEQLAVEWYLKVRDENTDQ